MVERAKGTRARAIRWSPGERKRGSEKIESRAMQLARVAWRADGRYWFIRASSA